jgi:hypothetical protein
MVSPPALEVEVDEHCQSPHAVLCIVIADKAVLWQLSGQRIKLCRTLPKLAGLLLEQISRWVLTDEFVRLFEFSLSSHFNLLVSLVD